MKYVLDTNAFSALMARRQVTIERLAAVGRADVGVPHPVLAEVAYGIERLPRSRRRDLLRGRYLLLGEELRRVEWTDDVSESFGSIKAALERRGQLIEDFDAAIAAHALAHHAILVTANLRHMARIAGLKIDDWG